MKVREEQALEQEAKRMAEEKYKREKEIDPIRLRPHPHEFELYFDI